MPQKYTPEFKARALQLIEERMQAEALLGLGRLHRRGPGPGRRVTPHPAELVEAASRRPRRGSWCDDPGVR